MSNSLPKLFNCPFCYSPIPQIEEAAAELISRIDADPELNSIFEEGKMMGVLLAEEAGGGVRRLFAFSGLAGGKSLIDGFVPPIFDCTAADINATSKEHSQELQKWLFSQYKVLNAKGESSTILDIFASRGLVPPGGTGDCAGPKLLNYAYSEGLRPRAMGEFWYGRSPLGEVRRHGAFYPSCTGKCGPLLGYMLQGLDVEPNPLESDALWDLSDPVILHEDSSIVVVVKPSGMLAVPGRTAEGGRPRQSLQDWLAGRCGCEIFSCHRLDMDTSGLMVFAKTLQAQAALQRQFENREVSKQYLAKLSPSSESTLKEGDSGKIVLPLSGDYYDRPRQIVDQENGKPAVTEYEVIRIGEDGTADVRFTPFTGRTHQLRVHSAHILGLGRPIVGDRLYGGLASGKGQNGPTTNSRLMLHASYLSFRHPESLARMTFRSEISWKC